MSGRWDPPRYGSFTITWSPSTRLPPISSRRTSIVMGIEPRWTGMCSAWAIIRPSARNRAQLASILSLMFGEYAVRRRAIPISSGTKATAFCRISSSAALRSDLLQLEDPVAEDAEPPSRRDDGRRLVLLDDCGASGREPSGQLRTPPYLGVPPSVVEEHPPSCRNRVASGADLGERLWAGNDRRQPDRDDLNGFRAG